MSRTTRLRVLAACISAGSLAVGGVLVAQGGATAAPAPKPKAGQACTSVGAVAFTSAGSLICDQLTGRPVWTKVLKRTPVGALSTNWLKWNPATCSLEAAPTPPGGRYTAYMRSVPSSIALGLGTQGEGNPVTDAFNNSWKAAVAATGAQTIFANYQIASSGASKIVDAARSITARRPSAVTSWNILAPSIPAMMQVYKEACVPVLQISTPAEGALLLGADNAIVGRAEGDALANYLKSSGKPTNNVTALAVRVPSLGDDVNQRVDVCVKQIASKIPGAKVDSIDMDAPTTASAQNRMASWLTANPGSGIVLACNSADQFGVGVANALKAAGRVGSGFVAGYAASSDVVALIRANDPVFVATVDPGFATLGDVAVPLMLDAIQGRSVPAVVRPQLKVYTHETLR